MMKKVYQLLFVVGLALTLFGFTVQVQAHNPHVCPPGFPDEPAITYGHLEQSQIVDGDVSFGTVLAVGQEWFDAVLNHCDGQGRPATTGGSNKRDPMSQPPAFNRVSAPDSSACAGCHNQPRSGGGGDFVANVFVLAQTLDPPIETINSEFSNDRNTLGMFGSGPIEMLAREMTAELLAIRASAVQEAESAGTNITMELTAKGISYGYITAAPDGTIDTRAITGLDPDLIVKPFHQAGVVVSLRQFSVNAFNQHHGLQAEERFDLDPTKGPDFDEDGIDREMTIGDITAVTLYQASLGVPGQVLPDDPAEQAVVTMGEQLFDQIGCAECHVPEMTLDTQLFVEPNPYNPADTWRDSSQSVSYNMTGQGQGPFLEPKGDGAIIRAYTDLKRHDLCDAPSDPDPIRHFCNEELAQARPDQDGKPGTEFFLTRKLWDVGSSAPYGHRGDLTTITEAIWAHGGEGRPSLEAFKALTDEEQAAVVKFLKTLQVLPAGSPRIVYESQLTTTDVNNVGSLSGDASAKSGFLPDGLPLFIGLAMVVGVVGSCCVWIYRRGRS
ncbi:MAG: di-heme oxidoredictase family protein [Candidatus Promineifilaceae bacterium]